MKVRRIVETGLLGMALLMVVATMVATALVAVRGSDNTEDLGFTGTITELARMLELNGPDRFGTLETVVLAVGADTLRVDTVAIVADPVVEPAVAVGGFLHDQISAFNDHAIRQALLRRSAHMSAPRAEPVAPSLFRTVWTEDGERRLSERPNPFVLTVRSPYAERNWRDVRTSDWRRQHGLLGLEGDVALNEDVADQTRAQFNRRDCMVRNRAPQMLIYCGTAGASDAARFYDVGVQLSGAAGGNEIVEAFTYRQRQLWRNGRAESLPTYPVRAGDLFDVPRTGPFVISTADHGTLAAPQWINGRETFANQRQGTIGFFAAAGRLTTPAADAAPLVLSFDAAFAAELEDQATRFMAAQRGILERMSMVVLDVRTGEVRAIVEPGRLGADEPLLAYEPLLVGSVVKPMVASAILARRPDLMQFTVQYAGDTVRVVRNVPLQRGFANAANGCSGPIDVAAFLRCSSNQYAAELVVRSLEADGYRADTSAVHIVPREILERSSLGTGLAEAFDVDAFAQRTAGRNAVVLRSAADTSRTAPHVITNRMFAPWESRPWILFPETEGTRLDLLARYAFGGWENRWTLIGVAQSYARIATNREVNATIVSLPDGQNAAFATVPQHVSNAFARVRSALREVGTSGTAAGLFANVRAATANDVSLLAKTGTLNEDTGRFKSLALVVGKTSTDASSAAMTCGLAVVTYFEFADEFRPRREGESLPAVHLQFANEVFPTAIGKHWERVSGCT
jgi:hypothetical protein